METNYRDPEYRDAAERHWEDAETLLERERLANADHLFGLSAECALKAVMRGLGMRLRDGKPEKPEHRRHINKLWDEFLSFANGRNGARYAARIQSDANPFADWSTDQRYWPRSCFTRQHVGGHKSAAQNAMRMLEDAFRDGLVT